MNLTVIANRLYPLRLSYKNPLESAVAKLIFKWEAAGVPSETVTRNFLYNCAYALGLSALGTSCDCDSNIQTQATDSTTERLNAGDSASSIEFGIRRLTPTTTGLAPARSGPFLTKLLNGNSALVCELCRLWANGNLLRD